MAITSNLIRITLRYTLLQQLCQTQRTFRIEGSLTSDITAANVGEAWWNDTKTAWRALVVNSPNFTFTSVLVEEVGGSLSFGEYAIPSGESKGTRVTSVPSDFMPAYVAVGCRLTVATRVTKPGQMRLPGVMEVDNVGGVAQAEFLGLCEDVAEKYTSDLLLGAPAALVTIRAQVTNSSDVDAPPGFYQDIVGFVLNPSLTSQVSRRPGHGT